MTRPQLYQHLSAIRAQRRLKPLPRQKSTPAKVARKANPKNLKQQDLFKHAQSLTAEQKAALAAELIKGMILWK